MLKENRDDTVRRCEWEEMKGRPVVGGSAAHFTSDLLETERASGWA